MRKHFKWVFASGLTTAAMGANAAFTAPAAFTTAIADATEAVGVLGAALIGVAAAGVVLGIVVKYVKRIRSAG